ncbi:MAG TPA: hypothetical protein VLL97_14840 [Acidobacteriota bacterium]|nr:hypothetical protein [Acidobacteriota bacterium]
MVGKIGKILIAVCLMTGLLMLSSDALRAQDNAAVINEVIQKHLQSFGKAEDVGKIKSRGVVGAAGVTFILGATGNLTDGSFMTVSEGGSIGMMLEFKDVNYPGEYFAYNGKDVTVSTIKPGQRSPLGDFMFRHPGIIREGLFGGVISVAWPLLKDESERPSFIYSKGSVGDRPAHILEYSPENRLRGMTVKLFFDGETYRHIRTEYEVRQYDDLTAKSGITAGAEDWNRAAPVDGKVSPREPAASIRGQHAQPVSVYRLVETFGEYANVGGIMMPQLYMIDYSLEGSGTAFIARWLVAARNWINNGVIDQTFFVAK